MSDSAQAGSVTADAPSAGTPAQPQTPPENGSAGGPASDPFSGLSEGTRKWVETKGYKSPEDLATAALSAEQKLGSAIFLPKDDAPPEEWDKVLSRLPEPMRPIDSPDKIEFKRPEGLPENLPYNDELANASKPWMVDAKLSPQQAQTIHDRFVAYQAEQLQAAQVAVASAVEDTHDDLVKTWGPQDSDGFKQKHELANRAMKELGLVDAMKQSGILLPDGALTNAQIAKAFAQVGEAMFREDTIEGGSVNGGANPMKPETFNMTAISELYKTDPKRARRLAREAGKDPDLWFGKEHQ